MKTATEISNKPWNPILRRVPALALGLCISFSAMADTTTLTVSSASQIAGSTPTTLNFPLVRGGDTGYDALLRYHTVDGSAFAGIDYTGTTGEITIPAGSTSGIIPIAIAANPTGKVNQTFQLLIDSVTGIGPTPAFLTQQAFATGVQPYSVAVADINGDGKPDLIVSTSGDNGISVLFNITPPGANVPSFAAKQTLTVGSGPRVVTVADINGDGKPDLVVTNTNSNTVSVLLNFTARGTTLASFTEQAFATGTQPNSVVTTDINGDGLPDLVVTNTTANTFSVLLNTTPAGATAPSFATPQTFATGASNTSVPFTVTTADVNGDGKPDVIIANDGDSTVSVLLNTTATGAASSSFSVPNTFATGANPFSVTAVDVNGDGRPDLVVSNVGASNVSVLLNTTAPGANIPSFATQKTFTAGSFPQSVTAVDLNGDGKPDLVIGNQNDSTLSVLLNTTEPGANTPSFAAQQILISGTHPFSITTADINGDGKPDLIVTNFTDNTVSVLLNFTAPPSAAAPSFAARRIFAAGQNPNSVAAADINGDGKLDVIVTNATDNTVSVLLNTTTAGATTPSLTTQQTFATGRTPTCVIAADINGDGKPDLIVANPDDNTVSVLLNTTAPGATPSFTTQQTFAVGTNARSVAAVDVNGDGKPDLIVANSNDNTVAVLLNTTVAGATTPSFAAQQIFATGQFPTSVAAADLNGDGKPDLIVANASGTTVSVLLNTTTAGSTTMSFATQQTFAAGTSPNSVSTADINGDGKPDLIMGNSSGGIAVLLNTTAPGATTASFATQQSFAAGLLNIPVTADVNGDGKLDVIVADQFGRRVSILLNATVPGAITPSFAAQQSFNIGGTPLSVATADINGDGKPDLIVSNASLSAVSVLLNTQYQAIFAGSPATGTIFHDYIFANGFE